MSTAIARNFQIGIDPTPTNNFTLYQPATPDGTLRLGNGNTGITSSLLTLTSAGNLGIGTANPVSNTRLHVHDGSTTIGRIRLTNSTTTDASGRGLLIAQNGVDTYFTNNENGVQIYSVNGSEQMRLTSTGLGIGTTSPSTRLTVGRVDSSNEGGQIDLCRSSDNASAWAIDVFGNTSTPSLRFVDNVAATARMVIDNSGNVGLGVTPSAWRSGSDRVLQIGQRMAIFADSALTSEISNNQYIAAGNIRTYIASDFAMRYEQWQGQHRWFIAPSGTAGTAITFTQAMTLDASGNLLVGATSGGTNRFVANKSNDQACYFTNSSASSPFGIYINYSAVTPNSTGSYFILAQDTTAARFYLMSNGGIANFSGNNMNLSDRREKTNFAPAKSYLETICAIPVQTFNYIDQNMEEDPGLTLGVVAQDVQAVAPELVMESNWGTKEEPKMRLSIYQTDLQYALMKCIQEQQAIINAQSAALEQLKADVAALKGA